MMDSRAELETEFRRRRIAHYVAWAAAAVLLAPALLIAFTAWFFGEARSNSVDYLIAAGMVVAGLAVFLQQRTWQVQSELEGEAEHATRLRRGSRNATIAAGFSFLAACALAFLELIWLALGDWGGFDLMWVLLIIGTAIASLIAAWLSMRLLKRAKRLRDEVSKEEVGEFGVSRIRRI